MNFLIRNLGWILLITFFLFMLYLISSQNNLKERELSKSWTITSQTGTLASKLQKIDKNILVKEYNNSKISNEAKVEDKKISKEKSILDKTKDFFSFNNTDNSKKDLNRNIKTSEEIKKLIEKKGEDNQKKSEEKKSSTEKNLTVKDKIKQKIIKRNENLTHIVWVKSIALNNSYFTKKVWYAYYGDKLEQLTNLNKYGCFDSKVLESEKSKGLEGWTCIYYMKGHLDELPKYKKQAIEYYKNLRKQRIAKLKVSQKIKVHNSVKKSSTKKYPIYEKRGDWSIVIIRDPHRVYTWPIYKTEVWSLYLVRVNSLKLNNKTFTTKSGILETCTSKRCDVLEQLTPVNEKGCFKVNVFQSESNQNKRGWVCQKYLR